MSERASYFEADAAKKLTSSLQAALSFALRALSESLPQAHRLSRFEDEISFLLSAFLESNSLLTYDASFSETLYGITRKSHNNDKPHLNSRQYLLSLSSLLVVPYIESKLAKLYDGIGRDGGDDAHYFLRMFHRLYPLGKLSFESLDLAFQILYLVGKSKYYSPMLFFLGVELTVASPDKLRKEEKVKILKRLLAMDTIDRTISLPWLNSLLKLGLKSCHLLTDNLRNALVFGIFAFKALEWWYSVGEEKLKEKTKLPIPPPPPAPTPHPEGIQLPPNRPDLCPLCKSLRRNPTQTVVSGYVFCYSCVFDYITRNARCPVTHKPTNMNQLRRLFKGSSL